VPLPSRFAYPSDAREQLERACEFIRARFGARPAGMWPSEGAVSDQALELAAQTGFQWAATDNGVLARTLNREAGPDVTYRPYVWRRNGHELRMIFRDHTLSDLIGFTYSRMEAEEAAAHFLAQIRNNCRPILESGRDALASIILDGENACPSNSIIFSLAPGLTPISMFGSELRKTTGPGIAFCARGARTMRFPSAQYRNTTAGSRMKSC
jgi:alpha-amylase/alpha-mannosidase (GH57 family)